MKHRCRCSIPDAGKTKTGYFWAMARDDRPWGGTAIRRRRLHLRTRPRRRTFASVARDYRGIVQCDGYAPYKNLPTDRIMLAFCWAHLRRKFFEIAKAGDAPIATEALAASQRSTGSRPGSEARRRSKAYRAADGIRSTG